MKPAETILHLTAELERVFGGRRWLIAMDVLAGTTPTARWLERLGATSALCIAASRGTGAAPDPNFGPEPIVFDVVGEDMMSGIRAGLELLANLPDTAVEKIDQFDPQRQSRVIGTIFDDGRPVAGRAKYGARPADWQALEDKVTIDALWDAIGVRRSPSEIVRAAHLDALQAASARLDEGAGTVWAGDSREGFHGGAHLTRWVETKAQMQRVQEQFQAHCDQIRVMPFLAGVPCSIHGIVFDDYVAALRPCEMIVFKMPEGRFHYGHAATFWDPSDAVRAEMRALAKRTGEHLRREVGYRGAFTIDGVLTPDGFRPTELNPRFGAALGKIAQSVDLPLTLLNYAIVEGEPLDWQPERLEQLLIDASDASRAGGVMAVVSRQIEAQEELPLVFESGRFRPASDGEPVDANARLGPSATGGIVFVGFDPERTPIGPSVARRAAAALHWADNHWELGIGELTPAVRCSSD